MILFWSLDFCKKEENLTTSKVDGSIALLKNNNIFNRVRTKIEKFHGEVSGQKLQVNVVYLFNYIPIYTLNQIFS